VSSATVGAQTLKYGYNLDRCQWGSQDNFPGKQVWLRNSTSKNESQKMSW